MRIDGPGNSPYIPATDPESSPGDAGHPPEPVATSPEAMGSATAGTDPAKAAREQAMRDIASRHDPRAMSFWERTDMLSDLYEAGIISMRTVVQSSLIIVPPHLKQQATEDYGSFWQRVAGELRDHPAYHETINVISHQQWMIDNGFSSPARQETLDLYKQLVAIRDIDPVLSLQRPPMIYTRQDPIYDIGKLGYSPSGFVSGADMSWLTSPVDPGAITPQMALDVFRMTQRRR